MSEGRALAPENHHLDPNSPAAQAERAGGAAPDHLPTPFLESVEADPAPIQPRAAPVTPAPEADPEAPPPQRVDPRLAMAKRMREERERSRPGSPLNIDPESIPEGVDVDALEEDQPIPQSQKPTPSINPDGRGQGLRLKVDGQEFTVSREDALRYAGLSPEDAEGIPDTALARSAQINIAAEQRLERAKQQRGSEPAPPPSGDHTGQDQRDNGSRQPAPQPSSPPQEDERALMETIQLGDPEEALAAQNKLWEIRERRTQQTRDMNESQRGIEQAVQSFAQANPDIAGDPFAMDAFRNSLTRVAAEELRRAVPHMVNDQVMHNLANRPDVALRAYAVARLEGNPVRDPTELLEEAARGVRARFVRDDGAHADPAPPVDRRVAEKRALVQQPARSQLTPQAQAQSRPARKSTSDVIQEMRRARHQT